MQSLKCPENWAQRTPIPMEKMPIFGLPGCPINWINPPKPYSDS